MTTATVGQFPGGTRTHRTGLGCPSAHEWGLDPPVAKHLLVASSEADRAGRRSVATMIRPEYCDVAKAGQANPLPRERSRVPLNSGAGLGPLRRGASLCAEWAIHLSQVRGPRPRAGQHCERRR